MLNWKSYTILLAGIVFSSFFLAAFGAIAEATTLRVLSSNPRYFMDDSGRSVYLTGIHERNNFQISIHENLLDSFDYSSYLNILQQNNHNFIRLWIWEDAGRTPLPFNRTGPGTANDGKPKFDLTSFNQSFFNELRSRVIAARDKGIYVSIMLFQGWSVNSSFYSKGSEPWRLHPFNASNNINGINGDTNGDGDGDETHTLSIPSVTAIQEAYVKKIMDTVNDLDNVLFEISNESKSSSKDWQYHMIKFIHNYEAGKPKKHPVGMTSYYSDVNADLFASPADWISPHSNRNEKYDTDPPVASGSKVIIVDTDHTDGTKTDNMWPWKSFIRGLNPIVIDGTLNGFTWPSGTNIRAALGQTKTYADKINLAAMTPQGSISSTAYALAKIGSEYLVYAPSGGIFTVNLTAGNYSYEWFSPASGTVKEIGIVTASGGNKSFSPPFSGEAVLYLKMEKTAEVTPSCNQYTPSSPISSKFASPYWMASNPSQLLINVSCPSNTASLTAGASQNTYTYKDIYVWKNNQWQKLINLQGTFTYNNNWYRGTVTHTNLPLTSQELSQGTFVVAYVATWTGGQWKIGCRTQTCTGSDSGKWSLMRIGK